MRKVLAMVFCVSMIFRMGRWRGEERRRRS